MSIILDDFKQYDPRWHMMFGRSTMAQIGCGVCTEADAVGKDPITVGKWMYNQGFVIPEQGTVHEGIVPTLRHFGYDGMMMTSGYLNGKCKSSYFNEIYSYVESGYCAIFLMGGLSTNAGGKCRNSYWTNAGHYIFICGARDGMLLVHDPASTARTGWHSVKDWNGELVDSFNGNTKKIWTTTRKWKETGAYMFTVNTVRLGSRGASALLLQEILKAKGFKGADGSELKLDGDVGDNTVHAINAYQEYRRKQGVELGTNGKNDGSCGTKMWTDILAGL